MTANRCATLLSITLAATALFKCSVRPAAAQAPEGVRAASNVRSAQYPRLLPDRRPCSKIWLPDLEHFNS